MQLAALLAAVIAATTCLPGVLSQGGGKCQVEIQPAFGRDFRDSIFLAEIRLLDRAGSVIPSSQLQVAQSSTLGALVATECFDGNLDTMCATGNNPWDPFPTLTVTYPCRGGSTASGLSKVVVENTRYAECCSGFITHFKMVFRNARGEQDARQFFFKEGIPTYTIPIEIGGDTCELSIQPIVSWNYDVLNLADVQLVDLAGSVIHSSQLQAALSSTYSNSVPGNCIDGELGTICAASTDPWDLFPTLTVTYPCSGGGTASALSKVVVENTRDDCCSARITTFTMVFRNACGVEDARPFFFSQELPTYTIPVVAGGGTCQLEIRPTNGRDQNDIINLAEIRLVDLAGSVIPSSQLQAALSSIWGRSNLDPGLAPANCFDGDLNTICATGQYPYDPYPTLIVMYPCSGGSTVSALSKVVVENRRDCCSDRILPFAMVFHNVRGEEDAQQFYFSEDIPTYTIPIKAVSERCQVSIQPFKYDNKDILNLAEVQLFDLAGSVIPYSQLVVFQSSTLGPLAFTQCFDGNVNSECMTDFYIVAWDPFPSMNITYPCSSGSTASGLSKVVVENVRRESSSDLITHYKMVFYNARGEEDAQQFNFSQNLPTYTIPIKADAETSPPLPSPPPPSPPPPSPPPPLPSKPPACSADNLHWTSRQCCDAAQSSNNEVGLLPVNWEPGRMYCTLLWQCLQSNFDMSSSGFCRGTIPA